MGCLNELNYLEFILCIISCSLSFLFSLTVIVIIVKKKLSESYSFKILLYISINDLLRSFIGFFEYQVYKNRIACWVYAYLGIYFNLSNMVWALCLTFTIFQIIVLEETSFERYHKFWLFSYIIIAIIVSLPFLTQSYGYHEGICQLFDNKVGEIWRFSIIDFPLLAMLMIIAVLFQKIIKKVEFLGNGIIKALVMDRGLVYVLIISLAVIPIFAFRILQFFDNDCLTQKLISFIFFVSILQGLFNGIAFFFNETVQSILFRHYNGLNATVSSDHASLHISFASEFSTE